MAVKNVDGEKYSYSVSNVPILKNMKYAIDTGKKYTMLGHDYKFSNVKNIEISCKSQSNAKSFNIF